MTGLAARLTQAVPEKTIAVVQSSYIPWKGYFDLINQADEFILFDDAQYTRRDWRNRNRIKTMDGLLWLSIPINAKGNYLQPIKEITVSDPQWNVRHWRTLSVNYGRSRHFKTYESFFKDLYLGCTETYLSRINYRFLQGICDVLNIKTKLTWSMDYEITEGKTDRIVHLCRQSGATAYLSGPSAQGYLETSLFAKDDIKLSFMDYSGYPEYTQLFPSFDHYVTILDLLFNEGSDAPQYMLSF